MESKDQVRLQVINQQLADASISAADRERLTILKRSLTGEVAQDAMSLFVQLDRRLLAVERKLGLVDPEELADSLAKEAAPVEPRKRGRPRKTETATVVAPEESAQTDDVAAQPAEYDPVFDLVGDTDELIS